MDEVERTDESRVSCVVSVIEDLLLSAADCVNEGVHLVDEGEDVLDPVVWHVLLINSYVVASVDRGGCIQQYYCVYRTSSFLIKVSL